MEQKFKQLANLIQQAMKVADEIDRMKVSLTDAYNEKAIKNANNSLYDHLRIANNICRAMK